MQSLRVVMRKGWLDPDNIETRVYAPPEGSGARPAPVRVPVPQPRYEMPEYEPTAHSVSNAAAEIFTRPIERRVEDRPLITPVTLGLAALCVIVGVTIGSFIGFTGNDADASPATPTATAAITKPAPRPAAAPAAPKPSPIAITVAPIAPPPPPPNTLRVESTPPGATVMFVSDGAATLVGTTPIDTTIDPAHDYDVLVTLADHTSKIEHVTPRSSHHLVVALGPTAH